MKKTLLALALAATPFAASASSFNYDFTDIAYVESSTDTITSTGYALSHQFKLLTNFYAFLDFDSLKTTRDVMTEGDLKKLSTSTNRYGAGLYLPLNLRTDVYANYSFGKDSLDGGDKLKYSQYQAGLRYMLTPSIEINPQLSQYNFDDDAVQDELVPSISARYYFGLLSLGASYEKAESLDTFKASFRFTY